VKILTPMRAMGSLSVLGAVLLGALILGLTAGPSGLGVGEILSVLADRDATGPAADIVLRVRLPRVLLGALVGGELHGETAPRKLLRQSRGGKEVPSCSAGGKKYGLRQAVCPLAAAASVSWSVCASRCFRCPAEGRLRVSPSAKPMVSAMARSDEPP